MEGLDQLRQEMHEAFRRRDKVGLIKLIRGRIFELNSLRECMNYVGRYMGGVDSKFEVMWNDFVSKLVIDDSAEKSEIKPQFKVIQNQNFSLTIKKEVTWDELNEFFGQVSRELGL